MPVRKKYILSWNRRAKQALLDMGATLTPGVVTRMVDDVYCDVSTVTYKVLYVTGGPFDQMTSSQFSRFLKKNKLSVYQKD